MQPNTDLPRPGDGIRSASPTKFVDTVGAFASVATNTRIVHLLFRTLINAFAPKSGGKKFFRQTFRAYVRDWDEVKKAPVEVKPPEGSEWKKWAV